MKDLELLSQKPLIDSFLSQGPRPLSSFSFVSIFAWCDFFDFELKMIRDNLCIFAHQKTGLFLYLPPLGPGWDEAVIKEAFVHMASGGVPTSVNRIENIPANLLSSFDSCQYNQHQRPAEYLYRKADLMALKGNAYKSQRHDCNCFVSRVGPCSFRAYTDHDFSACLELYDLWAQARAHDHRDVIYQSMLQENRRVHERLLKFWQPLGLVVRLLETQGQMAGYTLGFALDEETFLVYAEIVDLKKTGAAAYIFNSFCRDKELESFTWINTMDDFAMPKLAQTKKAYHPSRLIDSYTVSLPPADLLRKSIRGG